MNLNIRAIILLILFTAALIVLPFAQGQTGSPQDTLNQSVSDLQRNPSDTALRERIIKLVSTMNPKPAVPDEVVTREGAGEYAFKHAKTTGDYADAAKEYEKALLVAPWLAADYFNCGVADEKAENFEAAARDFSLYLVAAPDAQDGSDVRKRIGGLRYAAEKAIKDKELAATKAVAEETCAKAEQQRLAYESSAEGRFEALLREINGREYFFRTAGGRIMTLTVKGRFLVTGLIIPRGDRGKPQGETVTDENSFEIHGREASVTWEDPVGHEMITDTYIISDYGDTITMKRQIGDGRQKVAATFNQQM